MNVSVHPAGKKQLAGGVDFVRCLEIAAYLDNSPTGNPDIGAVSRATRNDLATTNN
jgi:hypothetical protein